MPKAYFSDGQRGILLNSITDVINRAARNAITNQAELCVIENIDLMWETTLQQSLNIDPLPFSIHHGNPQNVDVANLWNHVQTNFASIYPPPSAHLHMQGIFEYPAWNVRTGKTLSLGDYSRPCWQPSDPYPISSYTKLSYIVVNSTLHLILVDAPLDLESKCVRMEKSRLRTTIRFGCSTTRGGLVLPMLYHDRSHTEPKGSEFEMSLFKSFASFCQHEWHLKALFANQPHSQPLDPREFLYLLSAHVLRANSRYLDRKIKHHSFNELRDPDRSANNLLHDYREDLFYLRDVISETYNHMPDSVQDRLVDILTLVNLLPTLSPKSTLETLSKDSETLAQILMDSFSLLISSISTKDSLTSLRFTQLAFIYVPLSLMTGIFGMNMQQINNSGHPIWVAPITLLVIILCTFVAFLVIRTFQAFRDRAKKKRDTSIA